MRVDRYLTGVEKLLKHFHAEVRSVSGTPYHFISVLKRRYPMGPFVDVNDSALDYLNEVVVPHKILMCKAYYGVNEKLNQRLYLHDLSNFSLQEVDGYTDLFLSKNLDSEILKKAWHHHHLHNDHHPEHHYMCTYDGSICYVSEMNTEAVEEMILDWIVGDNVDVFIKFALETFLFHSNTKPVVTDVLAKYNKIQ